MKAIILCSGLIALMALSGCKNNTSTKTQNTQGEQPKQNYPTYQAATVQLNPTQGNNARGVVTFVAVDGGVQIVGDFTGLTPGKHGFHVHEKGDCGHTDAMSAGGHYNPTNKKHGCPDSAERHVGDFGNVVADENGNAHYERIDKVANLSGEYSIVGRSLVLHAGEDDCVTQPTGNSGARVACGLIEPFK